MDKSSLLNVMRELRRYTSSFVWLIILIFFIRVSDILNDELTVRIFILITVFIYSLRKNKSSLC